MIYFITAREVGRVKIGFSDEPRGRFVKMRTDSPIALELERICEGDAAAEKELHVRFAGSRLNGEWFAICPAIEAHMETLAKPETKVRGESPTGELSRVLRVSIPYASQLLAGTRQLNLSMRLAFHEVTGRCIGRLEGATDQEIEVLRKYVKPWASQQKGEAA